MVLRCWLAIVFSYLTWFVFEFGYCVCCLVFGFGFDLDVVLGCFIVVY